jgi:hypothetical protein
MSDKNLPEGNVHPWLPDDIVQPLIDIRALTAELQNAHKDDSFKDLTYPASTVETLVQEINRIRLVNSIEKGRASDRNRKAIQLIMDIRQTADADQDQALYEFTDTFLTQR